MTKSNRERRDWTLLIFIIPIGIILMLIAGQIAIRLASIWSINAEMKSKLDPNNLPMQQYALVQPLLPGILTPPGWLDIFLTPGFQLTAMPTKIPTNIPTNIPPATKTAIPPTVIVKPTATVYIPPSAIATRKPTSESTLPNPTATPTSIATSTPTPTPTPIFIATATATSTPTPTPTPIFTATDTATSTPTFTPTNTPTDTPTPTPIATDPIPAQIGTNPDGIIYPQPSGSTLTLNINIVVNGNPSWDLIYYELAAGNGILLDWVTIQISDGLNWYTVFNWSDEIADINTNVDFNILAYPLAAPFPPPNEPDQRDIPIAELYNSTGIAIELDSVVPPGTYPYLRIYAPPGDVDGQLEIDAIQVLP